MSLFTDDLSLMLKPSHDNEGVNRDNKVDPYLKPTLFSRLNPKKDNR